MTTTRCTATKTDGTPCRAWPLRGEDRCLLHSPEHADQVDQARRRGGKSAHRVEGEVVGDALPLDLTTPDVSARDIARALVLVAAEIHDGTLDPRRGNAIGFVLSAAAKALHGSPPLSITEGVAEFRRLLVETVTKRAPQLAGPLSDVLEAAAKELGATSDG